MDTTKIREQYPQYKDVSDGALLYGIYQTTPTYQNMPLGEFADKIGMTSDQFKDMVNTAKESGYKPTTSSTTQDGPGNEVITGFSQQDQSFVDPDADLTEGGGVSTFAHGAAMGWSDEILGHMGAITESLGGSDLTYDELYTRFKEFEESRVKDYWDKSPGKAFGLEVGGMVTSTAVEETEEDEDPLWVL